MNNACPYRISAAAGTALAGTFFFFNNIILKKTRSLQPVKLSYPSFNIAGSNCRSLSNIPHCCLNNKFGPFLNPNVVVRSLKPTTSRRLGKQSLHQLPDSILINLLAINF